ncbi:hypothetical protein DFH28DRAFT_885231, partial [Melampsora americana]
MPPKARKNPVDGAAITQEIELDEIPLENYSITPIVFDHENPPHITKIGNRIYISNSALPITGESEETFPKDHLLDQLEKGLRLLKQASQAQIDVLEEKQLAGKELSEDKTEWLNSAGNLIDEQLLLAKIVQL